MKTVGSYDQIKTAFQDIIAPEIHTLRADINGLRTETASMRAELLAEMRRLDTRIDGVDRRIDALDRELRTAIDIRERLAALEARRPS